MGQPSTDYDTSMRTDANFCVHWNCQLGEFNNGKVMVKCSMLSYKGSRSQDLHHHY